MSMKEKGAHCYKGTNRKTGQSKQRGWGKKRPSLLMVLALEKGNVNVPSRVGAQRIQQAEKGRRVATILEISSKSAWGSNRKTQETEGG